MTWAAPPPGSSGSCQSWSTEARAILPELAEDLAAARGLLPPEVVSYFLGAAGGGVSLAEAEASWGRWRIRGRVLRDVSKVDLSPPRLGAGLRTPIGIAPMAFQGLAHADGETATAAAAAGHGALFVLSSRSSRVLEDVAAVAGVWWQQIYVFQDRSLSARLAERAAAAGAQALVLTGDTPYVGRKPDVAGRRLAVDDRQFLANFRADPAFRDVTREAAEQTPAATMADIGWLHDVSGLPVLVKGVLRADEAGACLEAGAAGVIVSNHGGRQLDRALASAQALAEVARAVGNRARVLVDGGIRCGLDVLTALALGADGVLVGRPALWALARGGRDGVSGLLGALDDDLEHVLALAGVAGLTELDDSFVTPV